MNPFTAIALGVGAAFLLSRTGHAHAQVSPTQAVSAAESLPYPLENARRAPWGTILMGMPTTEQSSERDRDRPQELARELRNQGIEVVFSFAPPQESFQQAMRAEGLRFAHDLYPSNHDDHWNFHWFFDYDVPWHDPLLEILATYGPEKVAIHCTHGVDRTGNAAAFLMSVLYGVPIEDAWYAMASDSRSTLEGVASVLEEFGINDRRSADDPTVRIWPENGMKGHTTGFRRYMRCTINEALARGAQFRATDWHPAPEC